MSFESVIPTSAYDLSGITVRLATRDDMWPIYAVTNVAVEQKDKGYDPTSTVPARREYEYIGKSSLAQEWNEKGAQCIIANVPADNVSFHIADHQDNAIGGICMTTFDPRAKNKTLYLDKLYTVRTDYPIGSILLDHCIEMAQNIEGITAIELNAPFYKSRNWYQQRALFQPITLSENTIISDHFSMNLLSLKRDNFDAAREQLQDYITQRTAAQSTRKLVL